MNEAQREFRRKKKVDYSGTKYDSGCPVCRPGMATPIAKATAGVNVFEIGAIFYADESERYDKATIEVYFKCQGLFVDRLTCISKRPIRFCPVCGRRLGQ